MSDHNEHRREDADELKPVEQTLAAFAPAAPRLDRDRLMFLAGAASARGPAEIAPVERGGSRRVDAAAKRAWLWPAAATALAATSLALGIALFVRPQPQVRVVYVHPPAAPSPVSDRVATAAVEPATKPVASSIRDQPHLPRAAIASPDIPANNYLRSREVALRMGLDALGSPRSSGDGQASASTYFDWLAGLSNAQTKPDPPAAFPLPNM